MVPQRRLGRSGLVVPRLVLGAMMFGGRTDEAEARRIIDGALESGVNFIDTADNYNAGRSEEIVGRAVKERRQDWILATKLANSMGQGPNRGGLSRRWLLEETHASLKRLQTDYVDVLYLHKEDPETPLEETIRAIADLQRSGAIRYFGLSNFRSWRLAAVCATCDEIGIDRPIVCQLYYHALNRAAEIELLPACRYFGLGTLASSPLARGLLTGKYNESSEPPEGSRAARGDRRMLETEFHPDNIAAAGRLKEHAERRGLGLAAFAAAWVLANPIVTGLVAGPRTLEQWRSYGAALQPLLGAEDEEAVDAVVRPGTAALFQYTDPAYPVEGRPAF
jgi:aryl-alcohol dehydrogenase-like predicted oxidoreductase